METIILKIREKKLLSLVSDCGSKKAVSLFLLFIVLLFPVPGNPLLAGIYDIDFPVASSAHISTYLKVPSQSLHFLPEPLILTNDKKGESESGALSKWWLFFIVWFQGWFSIAQTDTQNEEEGIDGDHCSKLMQPSEFLDDAVESMPENCELVIFTGEVYARGMVTLNTGQSIRVMVSGGKEAFCYYGLNYSYSEDDGYWHLIFNGHSPDTYYQNSETARLITVNGQQPSILINGHDVQIDSHLLLPVNTGDLPTDHLTGIAFSDPGWIQTFLGLSVYQNDESPDLCPASIELGRHEAFLEVSGSLPRIFSLPLAGEDKKGKRVSRSSSFREQKRSSSDPRDQTGSSRGESSASSTGSGGDGRKPPNPWKPLLEVGSDFQEEEEALLKLWKFLMAFLEVGNVDWDNEFIRRIGTLYHAIANHSNSSGRLINNYQQAINRLLGAGGQLVIGRGYTQANIEMLLNQQQDLITMLLNNQSDLPLLLQRFLETVFSDCPLTVLNEISLNTSLRHQFSRNPDTISQPGSGLQRQRSLHFPKHAQRQSSFNSFGVVRHSDTNLVFSQRPSVEPAQRVRSKRRATVGRAHSFNSQRNIPSVQTRRDFDERESHRQSFYLPQFDQSYPRQPVTLESRIKERPQSTAFGTLDRNGAGRYSDRQARSFPGVIIPKGSNDPESWAPSIPSPGSVVQVPGRTGSVHNHDIKSGTDVSRNVPGRHSMDSRKMKKKHTSVGPPNPGLASIQEDTAVGRAVKPFLERNRFRNRHHPEAEFIHPLSIALTAKTGKPETEVASESKPVSIPEGEPLSPPVESDIEKLIDFDQLPRLESVGDDIPVLPQQPANPVPSGNLDAGNQAEAVSQPGSLSSGQPADEAREEDAVQPRTPANPVPSGNLDAGNQAEAVSPPGSLTSGQPDDEAREEDAVQPRTPANPVPSGNLDAGNQAEAVSQPGSLSSGQPGDEAIEEDTVQPRTSANPVPSGNLDAGNQAEAVSQPGSLTSGQPANAARGVGTVEPLSWQRTTDSIRARLAKLLKKILPQARPNYPESNVEQLAEVLAGHMSWEAIVLLIEKLGKNVPGEIQVLVRFNVYVVKSTREAIDALKKKYGEHDRVTVLKLLLTRYMNVIHSFGHSGGNGSRRELAAMISDILGEKATGSVITSLKP